MSDVRFNIDQSSFPSRSENTGRFDLGEWLVQRGIVRDRMQANYLLLGVATLLLFIAGFMLFGHSTPQLTPEQEQQSLQQLDQGVEAAKNAANYK